MEPAYAFTIPSIDDDTALDCRVYHPKDLAAKLSNHVPDSRPLRGAVIAHPYAPLGGCYDDPVVMAIAARLVHEGHIVGTFNFRGASDSAGSTSWTGKGEMEDYVSFAGFLAHYLSHTAGQNQSLVSSPAGTLSLEHNSGAQSPSPGIPVNLLLAGYSYGSLVLSRLPPIATVLQRFESAVAGTSAAEIILRARRLAKETTQSLQEPVEKLHRGRQLQPDDAASKLSPMVQRMRPSPVTVGGEETDPSERRRSRESHRSLDLVRRSVDVPHRIRERLLHRSASNASTASNARESLEDAAQVRSERTGRSGRDAPMLPDVRVRYLIVSPLLPPLAYALVAPPSIARLFGRQTSTTVDPTTGLGSLRHPSLAVWGSDDQFTSSKRLEAWAQKLASAQNANEMQWARVDGAGHFWREEGVMKQLLEQITGWDRAVDAMRR